MSKVFIEESTLTAIGNAIRAKEGSTALIAPGNMATKIANLPTGGGGDDTANDMVIDLIDGKDNGATITSLPSGITNIRPYIFYGLGDLAITNIPDTVTDVGAYAFYDTGITLQELPSNIKTIGSYAFHSVKFSGPILVPATLTTMGSFAFHLSSNITREIVFLGTPTFYGLPANALGGGRFTSIKVPWSEGEVAGAPWGATNATITYNYIHEEA